MNTQNLVSLLQENYTTCYAVFAADTRVPDTLIKTYTYKLALGDDNLPIAQAGDFAVVEVNGILKIVQIVAVHAQPETDIDAKFEYKWIINRVDLDHYQKRIAAEKAFLEEYNRVRNDSVRKQLLDQMFDGITEETKQRLLGKLK